MDFYQATGNQYSSSNASSSTPRIFILNQTAAGSSSSASNSSSLNNSNNNVSGSRKRDYIKPKTIIVPKRRKDVLSSISPSSSRCNNGDQTVKNLLDFFSHQQPSTTLTQPVNKGLTTAKTREISPFQGRGRPLINSKNVNITENMVILPAEQCAYKKHKTEDRIQRLFVFDDFVKDKGYEYGFYTRSKEPAGAILHGFYCMECSNIRKKREFDALIRVDKNGDETFMARPHVEGCVGTRDNGGRYTVNVARPAAVVASTSNSHQHVAVVANNNNNIVPLPAASSSTIIMNELTLQNMVRTAIQESSQQLIATMIEQIRTVVREEVASQLQAVNNNFGANY